MPAKSGVTQWLPRCSDIRVMTLDEDNLYEKPGQHTAQFVIDGSVRSDETSIKMTVWLTGTRTVRQIRSGLRRFGIENARLIVFQEGIARETSGKIAGEHGMVAKALASGSKHHPPKHATVYEAVLRYIEYDVTFSPGAFSRALAALERAVIIDPEYGPAWSMFARLYADKYVFDIAGFKDPLKKAFEFAQNGTRLSPDNQRCRAAMAYIHLFRNDLAAGLAEAERALNLGPETLFMIDGIGHIMTLLGDFERGPALIRKVIQLNPFYANYVHFGLWLYCLRQKNHAEAYHETLRLNRPALFWDHLARVATHGLLGNIEDGRKAAAELLKLKPDFAARGRILISHYIKFEDIFDRVIKGLNAVGVEVL
jgi:adenylate cyclase